MSQQMIEILETVAEAIWAEALVDEEPHPTWAEADEDDKDDFRELARAALTAMQPGIDRLHATIRTLEALLGFQTSDQKGQQ